jgi:hypothetical protein
MQLGESLNRRRLINQMVSRPRRSRTGYLSHYRPPMGGFYCDTSSPTRAATLAGLYVSNGSNINQGKLGEMVLLTPAWFFFTGRGAVEPAFFVQEQKDCVWSLSHT